MKTNILIIDCLTELKVVVCRKVYFNRSLFTYTFSYKGKTEIICLASLITPSNEMCYSYINLPKI